MCDRFGDTEPAIGSNDGCVGRRVNEIKDARTRKFPGSCFYTTHSGNDDSYIVATWLPDYMAAGSFWPQLLHSVGGCYHYEDIWLEGTGAGPSTVLYLLTSRCRIVVHSKTMSPMSDWNEFY